MRMRRKSLQSVLPEIEFSTEASNVEVSGICLDSRLAEPGDLYMCVPGYSTHGLNFVEQAVKRGAVAVITEAGSLLKHPAAVAHLESANIPVAELALLKSKSGALAARFYDEPSQSLSVIAVTGTDGKTSVCKFIRDALGHLGIPCGYIGTLGWGLADPLAPSVLTTPDAVSLQRMLAMMLEQGASVVALEASSHGIAEGRLDAINIDVAVLTNLGRDHLDYHNTIENYRAAKLKLFQQPSLKSCVVNADDELGQAIAVGESGVPIDIDCLSFGLNASDTAPDIYARNVQLSDAGLSFELIDGDLQAQVQSKLIGRFNVENLLACHGALRALGTAANDAKLAIESVRPVVGRMETFVSGARPIVVVDYAHTPQALASAVAAVREHCEGEVWVVFGCGGDRDPGKRAPMGQAAQLADHIVVTDDNPRSESPKAIRDAIVAGLRDPSQARNIADRRSAIRHAIQHANANDLILVAGKGHEDYQLVGATRLEYSDRIAVRELLQEAC